MAAHRGIEVGLDASTGADRLKGVRLD
jgi:hypothetical protein